MTRPSTEGSVTMTDELRGSSQYRGFRSPHETPELNAALAAAQGEFEPIKKEKEVKTGSYSYSYAPLDLILEKCRPILSKHGLALTQLLESDGNGPAIRTELRHAAGGVIGSSFPLPTMPQKAQELGSLLTYLRRYAIVALLGIAAEDDDDGAQATAGTVKSAAGGRKRATAERSQPPPSPPDETFYKPEPIEDRQRKRLYALFNEKGITERGKQLAFCTQALGRTIESSKEMGKAEATAVIRQLSEWDPENPQTYPKPPSG